MAKKIVGYVKLHIPAGKATPAPPVGPALGQQGVNIMDFCKNFNAQTAKAAKEQVPAKPCSLDEAIPLLKKVKYAKFDETLELALLLGVDPKHADQMVRGTVILPHGTGASKKVLVIATGEKMKEAEKAGAD